jgi:hypothetical protein
MRLSQIVPVLLSSTKSPHLWISTARVHFAPNCIWKPPRKLYFGRPYSALYQQRAVSPPWA